MEKLVVGIEPDSFLEEQIPSTCDCNDCSRYGRVLRTREMRNLIITTLIRKMGAHLAPCRFSVSEARSRCSIRCIARLSTRLRRSPTVKFSRPRNQKRPARVAETEGPVMDASKQKRVEILARQLWAAHGFPEGCYGEFYFRARQEIALVEDLSKVSTPATLVRLREQNRSAAPPARPRLPV
jgi:hypothetical protein